MAFLLLRLVFFFSVKYVLPASVNAYGVWCPTWIKNIWRYLLKSPFYQKFIQHHVTLLKSALFYLSYYVPSAVFCLGVDMNLRSKHRPRFYNIKEPFLSKNYTTLSDTFEISIILLHSLCSILPRCRHDFLLY